MSVTKSLTKSYDQENHLISKPYNTTIQELNHNQPNTNATVILIPAHQGIKGNEKADAAANSPLTYQQRQPSSNPLRRTNNPLQKK